MHLVFLNQYYPPDAAPTGVMLDGVVECMVMDGHRVTVLCAAGGYAGGGNLVGGRVSEVSEENEDETLMPSPSIQHSTFNIQNPSPQIIRIGATKFGRGNFVGKLLDYASYYLGVSWKLMVMQPRPDRIVALTTPPYLSVLARAISKLRGADHAHWVMDLYPDVMVAHGMIQKGSWTQRFLTGLTRWGFSGRRCVAIVTLGPDMARRCENVVGGKEEVSVGGGPLSEMGQPGAEARQTTDNQKPTTVSWVPLWGGDCSGVSVTVADCPSGRKSESDAVESQSPAGLPQLCPQGKSAAGADAPLKEASAALRRQRGWQDDEMIVMYSGNMGLGHRFGEILEVARRRREEELSVVGEPLSEMRQYGALAQPTADNRQPTILQKQRFVFYGGGKRRAEVEAFVRENLESAVEVHDYAPAESLQSHLKSADVHLVSLNAEWTGTMVPSKLQGIFAAARPVIFIGSEASSIAGWVRESGGGWVVQPGDVAGLLAALDEARDPCVRMLRGQAALAYATRRFDKSKNVSEVAALLGGKAPQDCTKV